MTPERFLTQFQEGNLSSRVYWFVGGEEILKSELLEKIKAGAKCPQCNWNVYYAESLDSATLLSSLCTQPFLSQSKFILIKNADKLSKKVWQKIRENIDAIPSSVYLVLLGEKPSKGGAKAGEVVGERITFEKPRGYHLHHWIRDKFAQANKKIEKEAISLLVENSVANLSLLAQEIEKLICYVGERENITSEEVQKVGVVSKTYNIWQLSDEIAHKNIGKSMEIIHNLLYQNVPPPLIIAILSGQWKKLWRAKAKVDKGLSPYKAASEAGVPNFKLKSFTYQLRKWNWQQLRRGFNLLLDADVKIKSGANPQLTLELLLFRIAS